MLVARVLVPNSFLHTTEGKEVLVFSLMREVSTCKYDMLCFAAGVEPACMSTSVHKERLPQAQ